MADYFEWVLTDVSDNVGVGAYELTSESFPGYEGPDWSISKYALKGGKQDGVDLIEIDNGEMCVLVCPTRGMGVLEAFTDGVSLGWNSPVRQVVHPKYINLEADGGLGWLTGFNELVCRCGLSWQGVPGEDVIPGVAGAEQRLMLPLHGTIANTPASRVVVRVQLQPPYELAVVGEVQDTMMFGPSLCMTSTVSTVPGTREFTVADAVENQAATPADLELLYHCNFGPPVLGQGTRALVPAQYVAPRDARAAEGIATWDVYGPPEAGFAEQCYFFRLHGDAEGNTVVGLTGPAEERAATIRFSVNELPAFTVWKSTGAECDGYVTGLEPGTDYPNPRGFERSKGRVIQLAGGDVYETKLVFGLLTSADEVARLKEEVAAICEGKESLVRDEPDPDYCPM